MFDIKYFLTKTHKQILIKSLIALCSFAFTFAAFANPVIDNVAAGNVTINQTQTNTTINQTSQQAILNWQSFNIGSGEATHFEQPAGGIALNRINPQQGVSQIYGQLTATGQIVLVNPAGIYFGPNAYVNVGGMIATTSNISDQDFLNRQYNFNAVPGFHGVIQNDGVLMANNGLIALVAPGVVNNGVIKANLGNIVLGSANNYTLDFTGNGLVNFEITEGTTARGVDKDGNSLSAGVTNNGSLIANGGTILVSAKAASGVLDNAINMGGIVEARSVAQKNGVIIFGGDQDSGVVRVHAKINATGNEDNQTGGRVLISGHDVILDPETSIDVSGNAGGGHIQIGIDENGQLAQTTIISSDVNLSATAVQGNGGFIETSGHVLNVDGVKVDTSSANGLNGMWLLDPTDLTIVSGSTNNNVTASSPYKPATPAATSSLSIATLLNALATGNVTVQTTADGGTGSGDITVSTPITFTQANALTLSAVNKIFLNSDITATNGSLILNAANTTQSITSGSEASPSAGGVTANINVKNFTLQQGQWYQVSNTLPMFTVSNNFNLNIPATLSSSTIGFTRALSNTASDSTAIVPVTNAFLINDVYGLEGIGSNTTNLAANWMLANNIDATNTKSWNSGAGFTPVGGLAGTSGLTGIFDGQNFVVNNLFMNYPSNNVAGLFGQVAGGTVENIGLTNATVIGGNMVGALVGNLQSGNIYYGYSTGNVTGTTNSVAGDVGVGGLVGSVSSGILNLSYSNASVTANVANSTLFNFAGGLVGNLKGNAYAISANTGLVTLNGSTANSTSAAGGLIGTEQSGSLTNSYSTTPVLLSGQGTLGGLIGTSTGGTNTSNYWNTDTSGVTTSAGSATGLTNTQSQTLNSYSGWSISSSPSLAQDWNIINGVSYPYLSHFFPTTPRVISGLVPNSLQDYLPMNLASNGSLINSSIVGANHSYYFLVANSALPNSQVGIIYPNSGSDRLNLVFSAPANGASLPNYNFTNLNLLIGASNNATITIPQIANALGSLTSPGLVFSISGDPNNSPTLNINNVNLSTSSTTVLDTQGSIISGFGNQFQFLNLVTLSGLNPQITTGGPQYYLFNRVNTISSNALLQGSSLTLSGIGSDASQGTLTLNATSNIGIFGSINLNTVHIVGSNSLANSLLELNTGGTQTFNVNAANNSGVITGTGAQLLDFTKMPNLKGGSSSTNIFTLTNNATLTGAINGNNSSSSTIMANNGNNTITVTGINAGSIDNLTGGFTNIANLSSGANSSTTNFIFNSGGKITGNVVGGSGINTLTNNSQTVTWIGGGFNGTLPTAFNSQNIGTFSGIQNIVGSGNDTLVSSGTNVITGAGTGNLLNGFAYSGMRNLSGNSSNNTFVLTNTGSVLGNLFGGSGTGNVLQNQYAGSTFTVTSASSGTLKNSAMVSKLANGYSGFQTLIGSGSDTLVGNNANNTTWNITGTNSGNIAGIDNFSGMMNLTSGTGSNNFVLANTGSITGMIKGGSLANNTLTNSIANGNWVLTGAGAGNVTNVNSFVNIQTLAGSGTDTLTGNNGNNTWNIAGVNAGNIQGVANFSGMMNLSGGTSGDNRFVFADNSSISGLVNGGSLSSVNNLDYSAYTSLINVNLNNDLISGMTSNSLMQPITSFSHITTSSLRAITANSTLLNLLTVPSGATVTLLGNIGVDQYGYVSDPTYYSGFSFPNITPISPTNPVTPSTPTVLIPTSPAIYQVLQQADETLINAGSEGVLIDYVADNINNLSFDLAEEFASNVDRVKIDLNCGYGAKSNNNQAPLVCAYDEITHKVKCLNQR